MRRRGGSNKDDLAVRKGFPALPLSAATGAAAAEGEARARRRRGPSRLVLLLVLLAVFGALALWKVPEWQLEPARAQLAAEEQLAPADRLLIEKELFQAETGARATLALILAAGGLLLGLGIVWRRFELSRELRSHERFAAAVEQLASERGDGSPRTETRLGGIYALERLANETDREYWPVLEVLTAYVRENAAWKRSQRVSGPTASPRPAADIQAVMAVIGRRRPHPGGAERRLLDLRETDLRGANLSGIRLEGVTLQGAHLEQADATRASLGKSNLREADLTSATLTEADLEGASLARAMLPGARLNGADLRGADLSGANLQGADLWEANLRGCNLKDADLRGADLTQCDLGDAILWRADLSDAVLTGANLRETHLERANLAGATGLTWEQGEDAYTDENTILPDYLLPEQARAQVGMAKPPATRLPPARPRAAVAPQPAALPANTAPAPSEAVTGAGSRPAAGSRASRGAAAAAGTTRSAITSTPQTSAAAAAEPSDNVVQLKRTGRRARGRAKPEPPPAEAVPKKAVLPKHRKPGLVKPA